MCVSRVSLEQNNKNSNRIVYRNIEIQSLFYKVLDVFVQLLDWSFHILLNRLLVNHRRIVLGNKIVGPTSITGGESRHTKASSKEHGNNGPHASRDERQPCCWLTVWELLPMQHKLVIPSRVEWAYKHYKWNWKNRCVLIHSCLVQCVEGYKS